MFCHAGDKYTINESIGGDVRIRGLLSEDVGRGPRRQAKNSFVVLNDSKLMFYKSSDVRVSSVDIAASRN